jgi:hypothetical protein
VGPTHLRWLIGSFVRSWHWQLVAVLNDDSFRVSCWFEVLEIFCIGFNDHSIVWFVCVEFMCVGFKNHWIVWYLVEHHFELVQLFHVVLACIFLRFGV